MSTAIPILDANSLQAYLNHDFGHPLPSHTPVKRWGKGAVSSPVGLLSGQAALKLPSLAPATIVIYLAVQAPGALLLDCLPALSILGTLHVLSEALFT